MQMTCWLDCNWCCSWKKLELVVQICSKLSVLGLKKNNIRKEMQKDQGTVLRSALFPVEKAVDDSVWDSGESGKLSEIHRRYDTRETVF